MFFINQSIIILHNKVKYIDAIHVRNMCHLFNSKTNTTYVYNMYNYRIKLEVK